MSEDTPSRLASNGAIVAELRGPDPMELELNVASDDYTLPFGNEPWKTSGSRLGSVDQISDFEEIEVPRGVEVISTQSVNQYALVEPEDIKLSDSKQPSPQSDDEKLAQRVKKFFADLKAHPEFARGLSNVKLGAGPISHLPSEFLSDLCSHMVTKINHRPRVMTVTSQNWSIDDFSKLIRLGFTEEAMNEKAIQNSLFRLYVRQDVSSHLKEFLRSLLDITQSSENLEVEYSEIYAHPGSDRLKTLIGGNVMYKSSDFKSYIRHEEQARALGFNMQTSLVVTNKEDKNGTREVHLRWYDQFKADKPRAVYIQMDHCAFGRPRVKFADFTTSSSFEVNKDMLPTSEAQTPVYDFIQVLRQLAVGQSSL